MKQFGKYLVVILALIVTLCVFVGCQTIIIPNYNISGGGSYNDITKPDVGIKDDGKNDTIIPDNDKNDNTDDGKDDIIIDDGKDDVIIDDGNIGNDDVINDDNKDDNNIDKPIIDDNTDKPIIGSGDISSDDDFEDYGFEVITVYLSDYTIKADGKYTSVEEVGAYIHLFHKLPSNFKTKSDFNKKNWTSENKLSCGGDRFYNKEGILPKNKIYTECDIGYKGGSRNAKRIVFASDWTIFYTDDHYESFKILKFV